MRKFYVFIPSVILSILLLVVNVFAATTTLFPTKDARVEEGDPPRNFGASTILVVRSSLDDDKRIFIQFDLSSLPSDVEIISAILKLFIFDAPGQNRTYELHKISEEWVEGNGGTNDDPIGEITLNNQPATSLTASSSTDSGTDSNVNISFNVTDDVIQFYPGELTNNGWRIKDSVEDEEGLGRESEFRSREFATVSQRPVLEITFVSCGISLDTPSISFGSVSPGDESLEQTIIATNDGTDLGDVFISGTNWDSTLPVSRTGFSTSSGDFASKIMLSTEPQLILNSLDPDTPTDTFWQFKAELDDPAEDYSQTITFTSEC